MVGDVNTFGLPRASQCSYRWGQSRISKRRSGVVESCLQAGPVPGYLVNLANCRANYSGPLSLLASWKSYYRLQIIVDSCECSMK